MAGIAVILIFFSLDLLLFEPLDTPKFLASSFLGRLKGFDDFVQFGQVWLFTCLHLVVFTGIGIVAETLFRRGGWPKNPLTGAIYGLTVCTGLFSTSVSLAGVQLSGWPSWLSVVAVNGVAGMVMLLYLRRRERQPG